MEAIPTYHSICFVFAILFFQYLQKLAKLNYNVLSSKAWLMLRCYTWFSEIRATALTLFLHITSLERNANLIVQYLKIYLSMHSFLLSHQKKIWRSPLDDLTPPNNSNAMYPTFSICGSTRSWNGFTVYLQPDVVIPWIPPRFTISITISFSQEICRQLLVIQAPIYNFGHIQRLTIADSVRGALVYVPEADKISVVLFYEHLICYCYLLYMLKLL